MRYVSQEITIERSSKQNSTQEMLIDRKKKLES